jgi:hypothetical protein
MNSSTARDDPLRQSTTAHANERFRDVAVPRCRSVLERREAFDPSATQHPRRTRPRYRTVAELDDAAARRECTAAAASSRSRQPMISESLNLTDSHRPGVTDFIHVQRPNMCGLSRPWLLIRR